MKLAAEKGASGSRMPEVPPVKLRLNAASWKMKKMAIVTTTKVCRRVRSATRPTGIAISPATRPPKSTSANTGHPPATCQSRAATATA